MADLLVGEAVGGGALWAVALQVRSTILSLPLQRKNEGQRTVVHMKSAHTHTLTLTESWYKPEKKKAILATSTTFNCSTISPSNTQVMR